MLCDRHQRLRLLPSCRLCETFGKATDRCVWTLRTPPIWLHSPQCAECNHVGGRVWVRPVRRRRLPKDCGIERGRFRRMPDGDYRTRRETSLRRERAAPANEQRVGYTKTGPRASSPRITYTRTHASHLTRHDSRRRHTSKTHTGLRHPAHNIQRRLGTHTRLRVHGPRASPTLSVWPRVASLSSVNEANQTTKPDPSAHARYAPPESRP